MIKLGYWDFRGFGEPIRLLLKYAQIPFEDIRYNFGEEGSENFPNQDDWLDVKFSLGLDFPNLPYLIDDDVQLTQSQAILKYLARKYSLMPTDLKQIARAEMLECLLIDIRQRFFGSVHRKPTLTMDQIDLMKQDYMGYLSQLECSMGDNHWLVGNQLSYVDFLAYEYLDWYRQCIQSDCFQYFPKLFYFVTRFEQLPTLKSYLDSDEYRKAHLLSPYASLGYRFKK